jgi:hypothetical protein
MVWVKFTTGANFYRHNFFHEEFKSAIKWAFWEINFNCDLLKASNVRTPYAPREEDN